MLKNILNYSLLYIPFPLTMSTDLASHPDHDDPLVSGPPTANIMSSDTVTLVHGSDASTSCSVRRYGATVVSWKVQGQENLFVSSQAVLDGSKAIRGGIPVCFPSFGPWEFGAQHGFARTSNNWKVEGEGVAVDKETGDATVRQWSTMNVDQ